MSIAGFPMKYSDDLKVLALGAGNSSEKHESIANTATDIFVQKCAVRSETKARLKLEAKEVIQVSKQKINSVKSGRKSSGLMGLVSTIAVATAIIIPIAAIPIAIIGASSSAAHISMRVATERKINKREEEEKVLLLTLFPEALRSDHIKEKAMPLIKEMFEDVDDRFTYKYEGGFFDSKETILERVIIDYKRHIFSINEYIDKKIYFQD